MAVALQHLEKDPEPIKCVSLKLPTDISYVVMKAMAKEQRNRYQTAAELASDLRAVLAEESLPSRDGTDAKKEAGAETKIINVAAVKKIQSEKQADAAADADTHEEGYDEFGPDDYGDDYEDVDSEKVSKKVKKKQRKEEKKKSKKKQKTQKQKKEDRLAAVLAVLTVVVFAVAIFIGYTAITGSKTIVVPDVTDQTLDEAEVILNGTDFTLSDKIEYAISDTVEDGHIISQDPEAKSRVSSGGTISVIVSIGSTGGDISVPNVEGESGEDAVEKIINADLTYELIEEYSDDVEKGYVIRQSPEAGTMVNADETIKLYISKGEQTATDPPVVKKNVPNLVGGSLDKAKELLQQAGLTLGSVSTEDSDKEEGTVISQKPTSGKQISEGGTVSVVVSSGKSPEATSTPASSKSDSDSDSSSSSSSSGKVTKTFTAYIPQDSEGEVNVKIIVDGNTVYNKNHLPEDESVSVDITDSGKKTVEVYIDGKLSASKEVDFS